jgi:hypothetical protein
MRELTGRRADRSVYVSAARQRLEDLERMFEADRAEPELDRDADGIPSRCEKTRTV